MNIKDTFYSILAEVGYFFKSKLVLKNLVKMLLIFGAILFLFFVARLILCCDTLLLDFFILRLDLPQHYRKDRLLSLEVREPL
jgi:hypothetical protein